MKNLENNFFNSGNQAKILEAIIIVQIRIMNTVVV